MMNSIKGLVRIARFDKTFAVFFDKTAKGFWQSAWPSVLYLPLYLYLLINVYTSMGLFDKGISVPFVAAIECMAYVVTWLLFPLVAYSIMKSQKRTAAFFDVMVPYKWTDGLQLVYGGAVFLLVISGALPMALMQSIAVMINLILVANKYFVVRQTYGNSAANSVGFIFIEVIVIILVRMAVGMILAPYVS